MAKRGTGKQGFGFAGKILVAMPGTELNGRCNASSRRKANNADSRRAIGEHAGPSGQCSSGAGAGLKIIGESGGARARRGWSMAAARLQPGAAATQSRDIWSWRISSMPMMPTRPGGSWSWDTIKARKARSGLMGVTVPMK
jgi:hypothetical protein